MFRLFKKFQSGLAKTASAIAGGTGALFGMRSIDAASIDDIEESLYGADFGVETTTEILDEIRAAYRKDRTLRGRRAAEIGAEVLRRALTGAEGVLPEPAARPVVIALIGVNGSVGFEAGRRDRDRRRVRYVSRRRE